MTRAAALATGRSVLAGAVLATCAALLWRPFWQAVPLEASVVPRYLGAFGALALFCCAALGAGLRVCEWLVPGPRRDGHYAVAFATGALVFGLAVTAVGHLGLFSAPTFYALPAVLLAFGLRPLAEAVQEGLRAARAPRAIHLGQLALACLGAVVTLVAVLPALNPENVNYDARWYHLGIAEQYVTQGRIAPSAEGNHLVTGPHLVSWLFTWAFLEAPGTIFDRVLLASLLEVACFLATLALIPPAARLLRPKGMERRLSFSWLAFFLFPAIFIYDTGLMAGADRFAAFWATAAFVTWFWARGQRHVGPWVLLGLQLAGTALCKYTTAFFLLPVGLAIAADALWRGWRAGALGDAARKLLAMTGAGVVATAPYWLRNLVFYKNPTYPLAHGLFGGSPWTGDTAAWSARYARELFAPLDGSAANRVKETLLAIGNHHVELYTWGDFTGGAPIFGSMFACLVLVLPLVRGGGRLWVLTGLAAVGIATWYNVAHQMRYLVIFVPLMAAAVAVLAHVVWSFGFVARWGLVGLLALQIAGSLEVPFFPTHRMNGRRAPVVRTLEFLQRGQPEKSAARFTLFTDWSELGARLPPKAGVMVHAWGPTLGIGRRVLTDVPGIQVGLSYAELGSVPAVVERLRRLGVTHLVWPVVTRTPESLLGELLFRAVAHRATTDRFGHGEFQVAELVEGVPADIGPKVMVLGCSDRYLPGLYPRERLRAPVPPIHTSSVAEKPEAPPSPQALEQAGAAIVLGGCPAGIDLAGFQSLGTNESDTYWLRIAPAHAVP